MNVPALTPTARTIKGLIGQLVERHNNPESGIEASAVAAAEEGRPAYWTNTQYHHAVSRLVCATANAEGLAEALQRWATNFITEKRLSELLATLVPLNMAAADELQRAKDAAYWSDAPGAKAVAA